MQQQDEQVQITGYKITKTLGKGTFGKVRIATHIATQQKVAVKILQKQLIRDPSDVQRISRQIKILKKVYHPFIITLYQIVETENRLYLFMQYASEGDLFSKICSERKLKQNIAVTYFLELLNGLKYLHEQGICHRDLKPQNLLLQNNHIKIADFGLGNFFETNTLLKTACGSPCYAAPEMISKLHYDPIKVDVWSSGIVLYAMIVGYLPFEDSNVHNLYNKIKKGEFRIPEWLSPELKDLLRGILNVNPAERLSVAEIMNHSWIKIHHQENNIVPVVKLDPELVALAALQHKLNREKLTKALMTKKHNSLTTTYYLWSKKQSKNKAVAMNGGNKHKEDGRLKETVKQVKQESKAQSVEKHKKQQQSKLQNTAITTDTKSSKTTPVKMEESPIKILDTNPKIEQSDVKPVDPTNYQLDLNPPKNQKQKQKEKIVDKLKKLGDQNPPPKDKPKNIIIQQQIKVQFEMTKKKQTDKTKDKDPVPLRKAGRMQTQNMKKTATRIYQRSGSRQTEVSIRLTAARKNKFLLKRIEKKPRLFNSQFFFQGHVEELRDFVKKIEPNNVNIQVEYFQVCQNCFYIVKTNMDVNSLKIGLLERMLKQ